jgi:hypothetical protein
MVVWNYGFAGPTAVGYVPFAELSARYHSNDYFVAMRISLLGLWP